MERVDYSSILKALGTGSVSESTLETVLVDYRQFSKGGTDGIPLLCVLFLAMTLTRRGAGSFGLAWLQTNIEPPGWYFRKGDEWHFLFKKKDQDGDLLLAVEVVDKRLTSVGRLGERSFDPDQFWNAFLVWNDPVWP